MSLIDPDAGDGALRALLERRFLLDGKRPPEPLVERVLEVLERKRRTGAPLHLTIPVGCYKSPRLESAPFADWAEVFHFETMAARLRVLADAWPFGVELDYLLIDMAGERLQGLSEAAERLYYESFVPLVQRFLSSAERAKVTVLRLSDILSRREYEARLDSLLQEVSREWDSSMSPAAVNAELAKAARVNSQRQGGDPGSIERAAQAHLALLRLLGEVHVQRDPDQICFVFRKPAGTLPEGVLHLEQRCISSSIVQFWAGTGCLLLPDNRPTILSPNQLQQRRLRGRSTARRVEGVDNPNLREIALYE